MSTTTRVKPRKLSKVLITQYLRALEGPQGCNFHYRKKGDPKSMTWKCTSKADYPHSRKILRKLGLTPSDTRKIINFARKHGGFCDCEILFNATEALCAKSW